VKLPTRLQPSGRASQPKGWGVQLLVLQSPAGNWGGPNEDQGLLITRSTLVVLKDLGLDPAKARKMMERVDKRLVFKPLNNWPFLNGETEPCINGRILGIGSYFKKDERQTGQSTSARATRRRGLELRSTQKPALVVPYNHLRARRTARIRTSGAQIGGRH